MYTVEWFPAAALRFADLWLSLDDAGRVAVLASLTQFKQSLTTDPFGNSESRDEGRRILFVPPLAMLYRAQRDGYAVTITSVWLFQTQG